MIPDNSIRVPDRWELPLLVSPDSATGGKFATRLGGSTLIHRDHSMHKLTSRGIDSCLLSLHSQVESKLLVSSGYLDHTYGAKYNVTVHTLKIKRRAVDIF